MFFELSNFAIHWKCNIIIILLPNCFELDCVCCIEEQCKVYTQILWVTSNHKTLCKIKIHYISLCYFHNKYIHCIFHSQPSLLESSRTAELELLPSAIIKKVLRMRTRVRIFQINYRRASRHERRTANERKKKLHEQREVQITTKSISSSVHFNFSE